MANEVLPFSPRPAGGISVSAPTDGLATALPILPGAADYLHYAVTNPTGSIAYIAVGVEGVSCTATNGFPVLPNSQVIVAVPPGATHIFARAASAINLLLSPGRGGI